MSEAGPPGPPPRRPADGWLRGGGPGPSLADYSPRVETNGGIEVTR